MAQQELEKIKPPSTYDRRDRSPVRLYEFTNHIPHIDEKTPFRTKQIEVVVKITGPDGSDRSFPVYWYVGKQGEEGRILVETGGDLFYTLRDLEDAKVPFDSSNFLIRTVVRQAHHVGHWDWKETRGQLWMDLDLCRKIYPDHVLPADPFSPEVPESNAPRPRP